MNATKKQIDLAIRLGLRTGKIKPFQIEEWKAVLCKHTAAELDAAIKAMNAKLGYDPKFAPATDPQLAYIAHLEKDLLGHVETTAGARMSYRDADARIKFLKAQNWKFTRTSNVVDLFTREAV